MVNEEYYVKITLPLLSGDVVRIEKNQLSAKSIVDSEERLYLRGKCEAIDKYDIYAIKFDTNWIEMLDIEPNKIGANDVISFTVPVNQVEICPTER